MKFTYEFAVVNEDGAFVLGGDGRLHVYYSASAARCFIDNYTGHEALFVRRIKIESPWKPFSFKNPRKAVVRAKD